MVISIREKEKSMNKTIRVLLIVAVLVGILAVAGSQTVWASPAPVAPAAAAEEVAPAPVAADAFVGTGGGGCQAQVVDNGETKGICGLAKVYSTYGTHVVARVSGGVLHLYFSRGSAEVCFAAPRNGVIYWQPVQNHNTWIALTTVRKLVNGKFMACTVTSQSGSYKFVQLPQ
jgi:hypothetical protein